MSLNNKTLRSFRKSRELVDVRRDRIDTHGLQAFVLGFSDTLVLLQYVHDFHIDGQLLVRRLDITRMQSRATDKLQRRMLEAEGLLAAIDWDLTAPLSSFGRFLGSLPENQIVILEDESSDEPDFYIGTIMDVTDHQVSLKYFSGAGKWDESPMQIPTSRITCCQTNTNYINFYARYFERTQSGDEEIL